jgi:hypothetical protein
MQVGPECNALIDRLIARDSAQQTAHYGQTVIGRLNVWHHQMHRRVTVVLVTPLRRTLLRRINANR